MGTREPRLVLCAVLRAVLRAVLPAVLCAALCAMACNASDDGGSSDECATLAKHFRALVGERVAGLTGAQGTEAQSMMPLLGKMQARFAKECAHWSQEDRRCVRAAVSASALRSSCANVIGTVNEP